MDLESGCLVLESVEDNEVTTPEKLAQIEETKIENNGYCGSDHDHDHDHDDKLMVNSKGKDVGVLERENSPTSTDRSPGGSIGLSPPAKGYGLKKWRRIKRDFSRELNSNVDTSKLLKRGLSNSVANSTKPQNSSFGIKQKSEGSVSSTNEMVKSPRAVVDGFSINGSNLDPSLAVEPTFSAGADSENSEDRSSKSSTAASVPKLRYERDKNTMTNLSGKSWGNSIQPGPRGKGGIETSKKARGERVKIEKENSHSSLESDSRSSNFVFVQGTNHVTSNGRQSAHYDGENSDEEQQFSKELRDGNDKENLAEFEDISKEDKTTDLSWEAKQEKSENHRQSTDRDLLVESILTLQSAQEALEKEVEKLREIGEEQILLFDDSTQASSSAAYFASVDTNNLEASSSEPLQSGEIRQNSSDSLETQVISLKENVDLLESKLEVAMATLKSKETKVIELETALESSKSPNEEMGSTLELQQKIYSEMEAELEGLFKQRIEAEVEYLAISRSITLFEEQKTLTLEQSQMSDKLGNAERKAVMLEGEAEKLKAYSGDIVEMGEVLTLQNRVCKVTSCLFIQLVLLVLVFVFFFLQLSPHYAGVVPT